MIIVGYLNPNVYFPALLATVVRDADSFVVVFPTSKMQRLSDVRSISDLQKLKTFIPDDSGRRFVSSASYAYGLSEHNVISGSPAAVRVELMRLIKSGDLQERSADKERQDAILEFLENSPKFLSLQNLKNLSEDFSNFLVFTTPRKLRGKQEIASSFLIQQRGKGATKTRYRKGVPVGRGLENVPAPPVIMVFEFS